MLCTPQHLAVPFHCKVPANYVLSAGVLWCKIFKTFSPLGEILLEQGPPHSCTFPGFSRVFPKLVFGWESSCSEFFGKGEPSHVGFDRSVLIFNLRKTHNASVLEKAILTVLCHVTSDSEELMFRNRASSNSSAQ